MSHYAITLRIEIKINKNLPLNIIIEEKQKMNICNYIAFWLMTICFKLRDILKPPGRILKQMKLESGATILDYGCGPGSWSLAASESAGSGGRVYAVDVNPLALKRVNRIASRRKIFNIETILTNCATGLNDNSVDIVIMFDVYHDLQNADNVMKEMHRVLKPGSLLLFSDHHLEKEKILSSVTSNGMFNYKSIIEEIYKFKSV